MNLFKQAQELSQLGIKIIPCSGKVPITKNGVKNASSAKEQVESWWSKSPSANIGIATGKINNLEVLDIDVKSGGIESLRRLIKRVGLLPTRTVVRTGSGGFHFYFSYSDRSYRNRTGLLPGIDFKTDGGYVIGPPSIHESGGKYSFVDFDQNKFLNGEEECFEYL
jgi:putative DNA primase/helicase